MTEKEPRIVLKKLKGFPDLNDNKIETEDFLSASKEIVTVIESFGRLFSPVVSDMNGNIEKLNKCYLCDPEEHFYLENLVNKNKHMSEPLLWLKRALELIANFFHHILNDVTASENVKEHLKVAYDATLRQHHNWLIQKTFLIIYQWVPSRSELFGQGSIHEENIYTLNMFLPKMQKHLNRVDAVLKETNLENNNKV